MRLRLRLALAFLLLSALPLAALALYSYHSSSEALRRAAEAEAELMARELELRVEGVATSVDQRVRALARLPVRSWAAEESLAAGSAEQQVLSEFASALPFLEGFQFVPQPPPAAGSPAVAAVAPIAGVPPAAPAPPAAAIESAPGRFTFSIPVPGAPQAAELAAVRGELEKVRASVVAALEKSAARRLEKGLETGAAVLQRFELDAIAQQQALEQIEAKIERRVHEGVEAAARPAAGGAGSPVDGHVSCSVRDGDQVVGELKAKIKAKELLKSVLKQTDRAEGEIPFALDARATLFVAEPEDGERLKSLPAIEALKRGDDSPQRRQGDDWVVVTRLDPASGYRFGIARPISRALAELKATTARNFAYGFALVGLALVGMVPLSSGLLKSVRSLERGAERIAAGDLSTRVPVRSKDEFGRLALSFNRMAEQLADHQRRLLEQERLRKQEEIERALLAAENERRGRELEEARRFQLSLLPRQLPELEGLEIAVSMTTATEVGGDYYDFLRAADGSLLLAIGDATGHGPAAGTMVTAVKSLFTAGAAAAAPSAFLAHATEVVHSMGLHRMAMALAVGRLEGHRLTLSSAGMPPAFHYDAAGARVREIALPGTPLGARAEFPYAEATIELAPGDALLLLSDGFPELPDPAGEPFGYERVRERFGEEAERAAGDIVAALRAAAAEWAGETTPPDDVTFLVLKVARA